MPRKTIAAALAAAVLLPLLVFVSPPAAEAHEQTTTRRYCAYDPFAGNQCWTRTVSVAHHHPPPNQTCPAGTTGTPPNCLPVPSDNTRHVPTTTAAPTTTAPPTTTEPPRCPAGYIGTPPNCKIPPPPPTTQPPPPPTTQPPPCPEGKTGTPPNCTDLQTATYTVKPCTPAQEPLEVVQRHRHPLGDSTTDGACHRADSSHCPAGHTEQGGHGSQNCRKNDNPDTIFTRIQHLLEQGGKAALDAVVETLTNEAADQLASLDIDWENFATDDDEQQKLLNVLNPVLQQNNIEIYTIDDAKNLWADINWYGRAGTGAAACGTAVDATMARLTKGKSLKPKARAAVKRSIEAACGIGAASVPVPDNDGDSGAQDNGHPGGTDQDDGDGSGQGDDDEADEQLTPTTPPPVPGDTNGDGKVSRRELNEAAKDLRENRITRAELQDIARRYLCGKYPERGYCE